MGRVSSPTCPCFLVQLFEIVETVHPLRTESAIQLPHQLSSDQMHGKSEHVISFVIDREVWLILSYRTDAKKRGTVEVFPRVIGEEQVRISLCTSSAANLSVCIDRIVNRRAIQIIRVTESLAILNI